MAKRMKLSSTQTSFSSFPYLLQAVLGFQGTGNSYVEIFSLNVDEPSLTDISHDKSEDSGKENRSESECYNGDVDTESYRSSTSNSSATEITDPARYAGKSLTDQDRFELLTYSVSLPRQYRFPVTAGRKFNPSWLSSRPWLRYSMKNDSLYCIFCVCFGAAAYPFVSTGFRKS